jgi:hypothetical protein
VGILLFYFPASDSPAIRRRIAAELARPVNHRLA